MRFRLNHSMCMAVLMAMTAALLVSSCNNDNCGGNSNGIPLAAFYEDGNNVTITNLTVYGIGAPNDSCIITNSSVSQVYLPLRITASSCQYVFNYNTEGIANDTITLNYDIIPYFESHECGAMYQFNIKSWEFTQNVIDSISIPKPLITNSDVVTINIHLQ